MIKPCNLFEVGARISAARQMGTEVAQVFARSLAESLINMTGEGISVEASIDFPVPPPRQKNAHTSAFAVSCSSENESSNDPKGIVHFDNALCIALLERACGGIGDISEPSELLTRAEHRFAVRVVNVVLTQVSEALDSGVRLSLVKDRDAESGPLKSRGMFLLKAAVSAGNVTGHLSIWLPPELTTSSMESERVKPEVMREIVGTIPLTITATLSRQNTSLRQVLNLRKGDILPLTLPGTAEINIGTQMLGHAQVVACDGQLALELNDVAIGNGKIH